MESDDRKQLVAAIRMLERAGIVDFNGHGSIRSGADRFLINSGRSVRSDLTAEDIVEIDLEGRLSTGSIEAPPLEYPLHAEIYRRRRDVNAIVHAHPKWSTYLSIAGQPLRPVFAQGALLGEVPVFPEVLSINTRAKGEALAAVLGPGRAAMLQSHGTVVVGADIVECFALTVYLEENAQRQYMAAQVGEPRVFTADEIAASRENLWKPNLFRKTWDYYAAKAGIRLNDAGGR
jgi:ribulose-5-phosphate 4-epimerase/fuculose-1-phosphate aldolase